MFRVGSLRIIPEEKRERQGLADEQGQDQAGGLRQGRQQLRRRSGEYSL